MTLLRAKYLAWTSCSLLMVFPGSARAQDPPAGTGTGVEQASAGATELDGQGSFATTDQDFASHEESVDTTELTLTGGGSSALEMRTRLQSPPQ